MSRWTAGLGALDPKLHCLSAAVRMEEDNKLARLQALSEQFGVPIYETTTHQLPIDLRSFESRCKVICSTGVWRLAIRCVRDGGLVFRELGMEAGAAIDAARTHWQEGSLSVTVTPYREPERSGTLWARDGDVFLELVFGPHYHLSKWAPPTVEVLSCWLSPYALRVKYSTSDVWRRQVLHEAVTAATQYTLGCSLRVASRLGLSVYAEFHWHKHLGYRFIECSVSHVWTQNRR